jgi:hypothetical protein
VSSRGFSLWGGGKSPENHLFKSSSARLQPGATKGAEGKYGLSVESGDISHCACDIDEECDETSQSLDSGSIVSAETKNISHHARGSDKEFELTSCNQDSGIFPDEASDISHCARNSDKESDSKSHNLHFDNM